MPKHRIIPQMFDVRPVDETGDLDWEKINSVAQAKKCIGDDPYATKLLELKKAEKALRDEKRRIFLENEIQRMRQEQLALRERNLKSYQEKEEELRQQKMLEKQQREQRLQEEAAQRAQALKQIEEQNLRERQEREAIVLEQRRQLEMEKALWLEKEMQEAQEKEAQEALVRSALQAADLKAVQLEKKQKNKVGFLTRLRKRKQKSAQIDPIVSTESFSLSDLLAATRFAFPFDARRSAFSFALASLILLLGVGGISYASKGFGMKGKVLGVSQQGYGNLISATQNMTSKNFDGSSADFAKAYEQFSQASAQLDGMGGLLTDVSHYVPYASVLSTGKNAVEAGKHIAAAGQALNEVAKTVADLKNPLDKSDQTPVSLLEMFQKTQRGVATAEEELKSAQENINAINVDDLPQDKRQQFILLKQNLPTIIAMSESFTDNGNIFTDLLGGNGPRKYLFLFQNNAEMRATGGFIGSYGLLDISQGKIKNFLIDGIFNPDGQLKDKIVPPAPIQKISAAWSMHDSNWFPDFPVSAREAMAFYEKTGGPTVDGVITLTPAVMQKMLAVTGPIDMPDYGMTLDAENFVEKTQYEVEVDYDKQENKPKQILADLAPKLLDKIFNAKDVATVAKTLEALSQGLQQKQILLYSDNQAIENLISKQGWSGEMLPASKDYLSVINTNINGFKTDAVVDESIKHTAQIQTDGSIIDTVSITRKHNGGNQEYEWYNKVNADYMRVYVPQGAKLLDAQGQTRETVQPPLDYDALGFKRDNKVVQEESQTTIDPSTGTRIYNDAGKTVFANWVYVSPGESATVTYKYLLPFKLFQVSSSDGSPVDSYSLVAQKQSGSKGSTFSSDLSYPTNYDVKWKHPEGANQGTNQISIDTKLDVDRFLGVVFSKR